PLPEILCLEGLLQVLRGLPPGVTELGCHPGEAGDLDTTYREERARGGSVLCDPRVRDALPDLGIELRSFPDVAVVEWAFLGGGGERLCRGRGGRRRHREGRSRWGRGGGKKPGGPPGRPPSTSFSRHVKLRSSPARRRRAQVLGRRPIGQSGAARFVSPEAGRW